MSLLATVGQVNAVLQTARGLVDAVRGGVSGAAAAPQRPFAEVLDEAASRLMAARDMSILRTPPPNRQPIHTEIRVFDDDLIKDAIYYEIHRGGQVFFVHNRVTDLPKMVELLRRL